MNLTPCYAKDAQIAFDSQTNNMIKAGKITGKEDYQLIKRQFHAIRNEQSEADDSLSEKTVELKAVKENEGDALSEQQDCEEPLHKSFPNLENDF